MGWLSAIDLLAMGWLSTGYWLSLGWLWDDNLLAITWLLAGLQLAIGYLQSIYWLTMGQLYAGYCVSIGWLLTGHGPKSIGWSWPKIHTPQDIHVVIYYYVPKWHIAAINTFECIVVTRFFWLSAGYVRKAIHFKTQLYTTMYQNGTWLLSIL